MNSATFRVRNAPLPPVLDVSPQSRARWLVAHDVAQRLGELPYDYALTKIAKHTREFGRMVRIRLDAIHGRPSDWLEK